MTTPLSAAELHQQLIAPFPALSVLWRVGTIDEERAFADATPYIDARTIQNRLDALVTPMGWRNSYVEVVTGNRIAAIRCKLELCIDGNWYSKEDGAQVDLNTKPEYAIKGAYSDALKRAAVQWGLGRYLHELARAMPQLPCVIERPSTQNSPAYATFELEPVVPPEFVAPDEVEAAKSAYEHFKAQLSGYEAEQEKLDERRRVANEEVAQRSANAAAQADSIARGHKGTHVPNTDAFSLRAPLVPNHQVPDGQQPASVMELLSADATARVKGSPTPHDTAAATPVVEPSTPVAKDTEITRPVVKKSAQVQDQSPAPETDKPDAAPVADSPVVVQTDATAVTPPLDADANAHATPVDTVIDAPRRGRQARDTAVDREAQAAAKAAAQAVAEAAVESATPSAEKQDPAPAETPKQASGTDEWVLEPGEDEAIFKDTLAKVRSGKIPVTMLTTYIRGPRFEKLLRPETKDYLVAQANR